MKSGSDTKDNASAVKRFQYKSPKKKQSLPQQWSTEFGTKDQFSRNTASDMGLDSAWSIRKNVAIGEKKSTKAGASPHKATNSVYSRHKEFEASTSTPKSQSFTGNKSNYSLSGTKTMNESRLQHSGRLQDLSSNKYTPQSSLQCRITPCSEQTRQVDRYKSDSSFSQNNSDSVFDF